MTRKAKVQLRPLTRREKTVLQAKVRLVSLPMRQHRRYRVIAGKRNAQPAWAVARIVARPWPSL